ncbi:MAG: hemolysin family protein [Dehalococcoidia bacterium]
MDTDHLSLSNASILIILITLGLSIIIYGYLRLMIKTMSSRASRTRPSLEIVIQSLNTISAITVGASAYSLVIHYYPSMFYGILAALLSVVSLEILLEYISKQAATLRTSITAPMIEAFDSITNNNANDTNGSSNGTETETEVEVEDLVLREAELGNLDSEDKEMIKSILELNDTTVREVMIPRLDMITVNIESDLVTIIDTVVNSGHTRLPVYQNSHDEIIGIIHSLDLLLLTQTKEEEFNINDHIRPAHFIPESKLVDDLLTELQENAIQMAIVVDEFGGTEGLVTMEDLLEEIVGEIEDEFTKNNNPEIVKLQNGEAIVNAAVPIDDISKMFTIEVDDFGVDTVGGYVFQQLGRMPILGDIVDTETCTIQVISVIGRRLRRLRIKPKSNAEINEQSTP